MHTLFRTVKVTTIKVIEPNSELYYFVKKAVARPLEILFFLITDRKSSSRPDHGRCHRKNLRVKFNKFNFLLINRFIKFIDL